MNKDAFIKEFSEHLEKENGVFFLGSGISAPSGFPTWKQLLNPMIKDLGITISENDDLSEIAQFIVNEYVGNKGPLLNKIISVFSSPKNINCYHESLVRSNVKKIWTTNFDCLIEKAFQLYGIEHEVKTIDKDFLKENSKDQVQILKMHGSIDRNAEDIILIQEDYEDFYVKRPAMAKQLETDLINNSFLFVGYSFGDINLKNILIETRRVSRNHTRQHFLVQKRNLGKTREQELWCNNIKRFGIETLLIDDFTELEDVLNRIVIKSKGKTLYITGSHKASSNPFANELGEKLAKNDELVLIDGQSTGISRSCINSYSLKCLENKIDINNRLLLFPNPYAVNEKFSDSIELLPILKQWRTPIFRKAQILILFDGGMGTEAELEMACQYKIKIIPVPMDENGLAIRYLKEHKEEIPSAYYEKAIQCVVPVESVVEYINDMLV